MDLWTPALNFPKKTNNPNPSPIGNKFGLFLLGPSGENRTHGLLNPIQARYQNCATPGYLLWLIAHSSISIPAAGRFVKRFFYFSLFFFGFFAHRPEALDGASISFSVTAIATAKTLWAPASSSACAQAAAVAPVVMTSSTSSTRFPSTSSGSCARKAPAAFSRRSSSESPA